MKHASNFNPRKLISLNRIAPLIKPDDYNETASEISNITRSNRFQLEIPRTSKISSQRQETENKVTQIPEMGIEIEDQDSDGITEMLKSEIESSNREEKKEEYSDNL